MEKQNICFFGFVEESYWLPDWLAANIIVHYPELRHRLDAKQIQVLWWLEYIDGYINSKGFKVIRNS